MSICQSMEMNSISEPDQWPTNQRMVFEITPDKETDKVGISTKDGFISVSLGHRILRAETAAITMVALVQYEWGDLSLT